MELKVLKQQWEHKIGWFHLPMQILVLLSNQQSSNYLGLVFIEIVREWE